MALTEGEDKKPLLTEEGPVLFNMKEVSGFFEQVGRNTKYIIHPEEIMADNFAYALLGKDNLSDPRIVEDVRIILKQSF